MVIEQLKSSRSGAVEFRLSLSSQLCLGFIACLTVPVVGSSCRANQAEAQSLKRTAQAETTSRTQITNTQITNTQTSKTPISKTQTSKTQISKIQTSGAYANSHSDDAILERARHNKQIFEDEEAIKDYTTYLKAHPELENVRAERADEYRIEHRFPEYMSDLQILMHSKNVNTAASAATDLGKLYQKQGKFQEAIKTFKFARSLGIHTLLTEMSDCARQAGDYETALQISNEIIKSGATFEGKLRRAQTYLAMNKAKEALADLNSLVSQQKKHLERIDPESREIYPVLKHLMTATQERIKCYDALKEKELAQKDRAEVRKVEQMVYNEMPFLTKDKK